MGPTLQLLPLQHYCFWKWGGGEPTLLKADREETILGFHYFYWGSEFRLSFEKQIKFMEFSVCQTLGQMPYPSDLQVFTRFLWGRSDCCPHFINEGEKIILGNLTLLKDTWFVLLLLNCFVSVSCLASLIPNLYPMSFLAPRKHLPGSI